MKSRQELIDRAIHRRAVEAVIWGMPAVNYERMLQAAIDNGAKLNQVVYWSRPVNSRTRTLTPNPDTIYLNPFYDTSTGPVVVEIPPATADHIIVGSFDVSWQNALMDVGPAGEGGEGEPVRTLRAFDKIALKPGESRRVELTLDRRAFTRWDVAKHEWTVPPGRRTIRAGTSSRDLPLEAAVTF